MITQKDVRRYFRYNRKTGKMYWKISPKNMVHIGDEAGTLTSNDYISIHFLGKRYKAHRLIWLGVKGYLPEHDIDHKDRIKHHNWWSNLREATRSCNMINTGIQKNNTSGVKGVTYDKDLKKWKAQIKAHNKQRFLGSSLNFDEAVCHRLAAEQCLNWDKYDSNSSAHQYMNEVTQ